MLSHITRLLLLMPSQPRPRTILRQTEALVNRMFKDQSKPLVPDSFERSSHVTQLESILRDKLATKVRIVEKKGGKGEIHIQYFSNDDLDRLLDIMN